jgi:hypothetical protein
MHSTNPQEDPEPQKGFARLLWKIRSGGLAWIGRRLAHEATQPSTHLGQALHMVARRLFRAAAALPRAVRRLNSAPSPVASTTLYAFYDLQVAPITFDILWFLASAELERRRRDLPNVHVVIVPGRYFGVRQEREDYERVITAQARQARIHDMLIPCCNLLPTCRGVTLATTRDEGANIRSVVARHIAPTDYEPAMPTTLGPHACMDAARQGVADIACLRAPAKELQAVQQWIAAQAGSRRVITITLRRYDYMPARNSNIQAWCAFARRLDLHRYLPVFVPDFYDLGNEPPAEIKAFVMFPEAARSITMRMALYQSAYLNLGVNNGPMGLAWLNERARYATLKMITPDVPQATIDYMQTFGFEPGKSLPFAKSTQRWIWEDDSEDAITRTFSDMCERIDGEKARTPR